MKKILIIEPCHEDYGGFFRAFNICKELSEYFEVDLLISSKNEKSFFIKKKKINRNLTVYHLPRFKINFFFNGRFLRGIIGTIISFKKKYDYKYFFSIVQFESLIPFLINLIFYSRKKIIIDWDDYWSGLHHTIPFYNKYFGLIKFYLQFIEYKVQSLTQNASCTSNFLIDELDNIRVKNKIKIINGCNTSDVNLVDKFEAREKLNIKKNQKMLLTFGHTFFKERTENLITFANNLYEIDPSINIYINLDIRKLLKENSVKNLKISKNFVNVGYLKKDRLDLFLSATDAIVFTVGSTPYEKACFPIRVSKFVLAKKPIIINDADTEASNFLIKNNIAISDKDIKKLSEKANNFIYKMENAFDISHFFENAIKNLSWKRQGKILKNFLLKL